MQKKGLAVKEIYGFKKSMDLKLPLFISKIKAGFPSPADDYIEKDLDLNSFLIKHPAATFFLRVEGDSMVDAGINSGDILIVDKSITAKNSSIVIAVINGELTVKRIQKSGKKLYLVPENEKYPPIEIMPDMDFQIWGVVTNVIHSVE